MRNLEYFSPSSFSIYEKSKEEFFLQYLADVKAPRLAQTKPMSIGSAFDAYIKNFLHDNLFGKGHDPKFDLITLFNTQVEKQNRSWAFEHGRYVFDCYRKSGALSDLMLELESSKSKPNFEFEIRGPIKNVTLLGRPDLYFINKHGNKIILDWKLNGYCGNYNTSPISGYLKLRPYGGQHRDCFAGPFNGSIINLNQYLNIVRPDWAIQLSLYAWLLGCEIGEQFIVAIDQIVAKPSKTDYPDLRIAEHRLRVQSDFQQQLFSKIELAWETVHSNHYFRELSLEESQAKCIQLEQKANALRNPTTEQDVIFNSMTR